MDNKGIGEVLESVTMDDPDLGIDGIFTEGKGSRAYGALRPRHDKALA